MAMDKTTMANAIKAGMDSIDPSSYDLTTVSGVNAYRQALLEEFADAINSHIASNAQSEIKGAFASGVPVPNDGGAALQTAWGAQPPLVGVIS